MAQKATAETDGSGSNHPAADLETIVVDVDDIIECERRNARDRDEQRTHVLRVSPPFEGERTASLHVSEDYSYYPPEMDPKPIHLAPHQFHDAEFGYPESWEVHAAAKEVDGVEDLADVSEETLEECWDVQLEVWEGNVRSSLKDELELTDLGWHGTGNVESPTVPVEFVEDEA